MTSRKPKGGRRDGPYAWQKLAFAEDLEADPTLSGVQKGLIGTIAKNYDNRTGQSVCSLSFLAAAAGTTKKVVGKYVPVIVGSNRVSIIRKGAGRESTLWHVNWWFRGSGFVRMKNDGNPILDCRELTSESPKTSLVESPKMSPRRGDAVGDSNARRVPHVGDQSLSSPKGERKVTGDLGAWAFRPAPGAVTSTQLVMVKESNIVMDQRDEMVARFSISNVGDGAAYGELEIVVESNTADRQSAGQSKLAHLSRVTGVHEVSETTDLHSIPFLMTHKGDLMPDPENQGAMQHPDLYELANILDRLVGARVFWRSSGPDKGEVVAELRRLAAIETKEVA